MKQALCMELEGHDQFRATFLDNTVPVTGISQRMTKDWRQINNNAIWDA